MNSAAASFPRARSSLAIWTYADDAERFRAHVEVNLMGTVHMLEALLPAALTLLPALLSYLGPRVDRLRIPFLGRTLKAEGDGESPAARRGRRRA